MYKRLVRGFLFCLLVSLANACSWNSVDYTNLILYFFINNQVPVTGITLNKTSVTISAGSVEQLAAAVAPANATFKFVTWSSSDPATASVGWGGLVTAVAPGTATITASTFSGGYTADCLITVTDYGVAQWARTLVAASNVSMFYNVAAAPDGSVYGAGLVLGATTYDFGNGATATPDFGSRNCILVKYDGSGNALWARTVTGGNDDSAFTAVAVAEDGSVYAAGVIYGDGVYDFGNGVTTAGSAGVDNAVLVKYDGSGAARWARTVTSLNNSMFQGVAAARDGSVYAIGSMSGTDTCDYGNGATAAGTFGGGDNAVVVKYNSAGSAQWARSVTAGSDESVFNSVSAGQDGSVSVSGSITGSGAYDFGNGATATGGYASGLNAVAVKYDNSGLAQWARSAIGGSDTSFFMGVTTAPDGSVYASGLMDGTAAFDFESGITATGTHTGDNAVLVKYNSAGLTQWAQTVTVGADNSGFLRVSAASDGSIYAAGGIRGTATYDFGNSVTVAGTYAGGMNPLLIKYNSSGVARWACSTAASSAESFFYGISVAPDGTVYTGGAVYGVTAFDFGNGATTAGPFAGQNTLVVQYK